MGVFMVTLVGLNHSNFDADRYRSEMLESTICPHCGKSSNAPVGKNIISNSNIPMYDEDVLRDAIEKDTLDFGIMD